MRRTRASILSTTRRGSGALLDCGAVDLSVTSIHMSSFRPEARLNMFGDGHGPGEDAEHWAIDRGFRAGIEFAGRVTYGWQRDRPRPPGALVDASAPSIAWMLSPHVYPWRVVVPPVDETSFTR